MNLSLLFVFIVPTLVASVETTDTSTTKQQQLRKRKDAWTTYFEDEVYEKSVSEERELHADRYHIFRGYHSSSKSGKSGTSSSRSYSCSSSSSSGKSGKSCSSSSTRSTSSKSGKSGSSSRRLDKRLVNLRASLRSEDLSADEELERELHPDCKACVYDHMKMFKEQYRGHHWYSSSKSGKSGSRSYSCSSSSSGKSGKSCSSSSSSSSTRSSSKSGKSGSSRSSSYYSTSKSGKSGSSSHRLRA